MIDALGINEPAELKQGCDIDSGLIFVTKPIA